MYRQNEGPSESWVRVEANPTWVTADPRDGGHLVLRLLDWEAALGNAWEIAGGGLPRYQVSLTAISPGLTRSGASTSLQRGCTPAERARQLADAGLGRLVWVEEGNSRARLLRRARLQLEALGAGARPTYIAA